MKSHGFTKRLLTLILAAAMLISDQTILFAAQNGDLQDISGDTSGNTLDNEDSSQQAETGTQTPSSQTDTEMDTNTPPNGNPGNALNEQNKTLPGDSSGNISGSGNDTSLQDSSETPPSSASLTQEDPTQGNATQESPVPGDPTQESPVLEDPTQENNPDTTGNSLPENNSAFSSNTLLEETGGSDAVTEFTTSESWMPKYAENVYEEEMFDFQQTWIGQGDENYAYQDSYGSQLTDKTALAFYQELQNSLEELLLPEESTDEAEEHPGLPLGTLNTPSQELESDAADAFRTAYETAAQNAFDAFWFDEADASRLDTSSCTLTITYTGTQQEDETWNWEASAVWTLQLLDEDNAHTEAEETAGNASSAEEENTTGAATTPEDAPAESQESTDPQEDIFLTLAALYEQTLSYKEEILAERTETTAAETESSEEPAPAETPDSTEAITDGNALPEADASPLPDEDASALSEEAPSSDTPGEEAYIPPAGEVYARYFKKLCEEAEIENALVMGIADEELSVWNLVHVPDGQWYAVDAARDVFLEGAGDASDETAFSNTHIPYGDFSNSHLGFFTYPELSMQPYAAAVPAIMTLEAPLPVATAPAEEAEKEPAEEDTLPQEEPAAAEVPAPASAAPVTIDLSQCSYQYDDLWTTQDNISQVLPTSLTYQGKELTLGTDYSIAYQGANRSAATDLSNPGKYTMILTGMGAYSGTLALSFRVANGTSVNTLSASSIKTQRYSGKALTPKLTLKDPATRKTLKAGTHYSISYENNVNAGTATIVIRGIEANGYAGIRRITFTIQPLEIKKVSAKILDKKIYYTGTAQTPRVSLTYKKMGLVEGRDYQISYSSNTNKGKGLITLTGLGNYSSSRTLKFTISARKMKEANIVMSATQDTYDGPTLYPTITVSYNGLTCKEGSDYTVSYPKKLKAGRNTIKVKGKNNFTGSVSLKFTINKASMENAVVTLPYAWAYTGKNVKVIPSRVVVENTVLTYKKDYTIKYVASNGKRSSSVKKLGEYQILLTGKGNYIGTLALKFCITDDQTLLNNNYNSGAGTVTGGNTFTLNSCRASAYDGRQITVTLSAGRNTALEGLGTPFYVARMNSSGTIVLEAMAGNVSSSGSFSISASFPASDRFQAGMMSKYAIAIRNGSGYQIVSTARYLENPEITATMNKDYLGYYTSNKISSKKGMQGASDAYTEDMAVQHVLLNVDLADMVSTSPRSGYVPYSYKGTTYYFQDMIALVQTMRYLNGWDSNNPYGSHNRSITLVLLMSWSDELSYLIHPSARKKGASYYALNMKEENARNTFEALFCYMGEKLGTEKSRVSNWTLGNEVNSCKVWNYSGNMSVSECAANYAQAFQLLYQGVRRTSSTSRVFISLDHCWTASDAGHSGKQFLDQFASYMNQTAPSMEWNVNYHPYSQPLTRTAFWSDNSNTTNSSGTKYISMKNIQVLTNYLGSLESQYGKSSGSIRVIIGELGYTAVQGKASQETAQAAALGYGYYIAMFNSRIDAYIVRAYLDDLAETSSGLYLGVMSKNHVKKQSYDVYKYLDTNQSLEYMNRYLSTIGISSWESAISGFNPGALPSVDF